MALRQFISTLGRFPVLGSLLRKFAARYPEGSVVTIRSGLCKGLRWKRHHRYVNGYWVGIAESRVQDQLGSMLNPGDVFYDIGANAGFFTLAAAKIVGPEGRVVSFDPLPENAQSITEQLELNDFSSRASVREEAVGEACGKSTFVFEKEGDSTARLGETSDRHSNSLEVQVTTLDSLLEHEPPPQLIKMDVEGGEVGAFKGALKLLKEHKPTIILEVHSQPIAKELRPLVADFYEWKDVEAPSENHPWHVLLEKK